MVRTWTSRWELGVQSDTDIVKFLDSDRPKGRRPTPDITETGIMEIIEEGLPKGRKRWTAPLISHLLGIDRGLPEFHTVRRLWTRMLKKGMKNVPVRAYSRKYDT